MEMLENANNLFYADDAVMIICLHVLWDTWLFWGSMIL